MLIILASCTTTSKDLWNNSASSGIHEDERTLLQISSYKNFFIEDINLIQDFLYSAENQEEIKAIKLLKNNYKKILSHDEYTITLDINNKHSDKLIELIYEINLPTKIFWTDESKSDLPRNILSNKVNGFCESLYDDAIKSIMRNVNADLGSPIVIFSPKYEDILQNLRSYDANIETFKFSTSGFQEFVSKILEINLSKERFKKISNLNPNQKLNFSPRPRRDFKEIILLLEPSDYKAMIPALRYHAGRNFKYYNFISALEEINTPVQLLDYEDSYIPLSIYSSMNIGSGHVNSLEGFLEEGMLKDWLLIQVLMQSGAKSTSISGITGEIYFRPNVCSKREIPLQIITSELFAG